jgi:hypothetical protein
MTSRRRRTSHTGRRGHDRYRRPARPRGTWNRSGVVLLVIMAALIVMSHYGLHVHITR